MKDSQISIGFILLAMTGVAMFVGIAVNLFEPKLLVSGMIVFALFFAVSFGFTGQSFGHASSTTGRPNNIRLRVTVGIVVGSCAALLSLILGS